MRGDAGVSSPVKHSNRFANLSIVKTVSEVPPATVVHGTTAEVWNKPRITEVGRCGLDGCVVADWDWFSGPVVACRGRVPGVVVPWWVWDPGPALAEPGVLADCDADSGALPERVGAE